MYLPCFLISSEKTEWEAEADYLDNDLVLVPVSRWRKEELFRYPAQIIDMPVETPALPIMANKTREALESGFLYRDCLLYTSRCV